MTNLIAKLQASFLKPILPAFFFFAGVTYDSLTLTRIDRLFDNLILLLYLAVLGVLVILTGRFQLGLIPVTPAITSWNALSLIHRAQPHLAKGLQFLLGGLFSAYAIFYSQSTSFSTTAVCHGCIDNWRGCLEDRSPDISRSAKCVPSNHLHDEPSGICSSGSVYGAVLLELDPTHSSLFKVRRGLSSD
jgi:hypothetical protein